MLHGAAFFIDILLVHALFLFIQVQATHPGYLQSLLEIVGDTAYTSSLQSRHIWWGKLQAACNSFDINYVYSHKNVLSFTCIC